MSCRTKTLESVLSAMGVQEKSMYAIIKDSGVSQISVMCALKQLEREGKVKQVTDAVGQVYPRWMLVV